MKTRKTKTLLALAGVLAVALLALPVRAQELRPSISEWCDYAGTIAENAATRRDAGMSYTQAAHMWTRDPDLNHMNVLKDDLAFIAFVYQRPFMAPRDERVRVTDKCIRWLNSVDGGPPEDDPEAWKKR